MNNSKKNLIVKQLNNVVDTNISITQKQDIIFNYKIIKFLGKGNFGTVHLAKNIGEGQKYQEQQYVAIKKLQKRQSSQQGVNVSFIREISILKKLNDNSISVNACLKAELSNQTQSNKHFSNHLKNRHSEKDSKNNYDRCFNSKNNIARENININNYLHYNSNILNQCKNWTNNTNKLKRNLNLNIVANSNQNNHIIKLLGYSLGNENEHQGYIVLEYMPTDLQKYIMKYGALSIQETKIIIKQILIAVKHCHQNYIIHRDIKPSNILLNRQLQQKSQKVQEQYTKPPLSIKLTDFGIATHLQQNPRENTAKIAALYYRSPQLLLHYKKSGFSIDLWSVGCILAECLLGKILFKSETFSQYSQLCKIFQLFGLNIDQKTIDLQYQQLKNNVNSIYQRPVQEKIQQFQEMLNKDPQNTNQALDILNKMLTIDPNKRINVDQALNHSFFKSNQHKDIAQSIQGFQHIIKSKSADNYTQNSFDPIEAIQDNFYLYWEKDQQLQQLQKYE